MDNILLSKGLKAKGRGSEMTIITHSREEGTLIKGTARPEAEVTTWQERNIVYPQD
ncbi:hypothetical protein [Mesobacillus zeae]|uniref:hypothetical protein n=1 Tax=Mesobacillus zeae TaxID=1917180 RepID=UPI0015E6CA04|nr:hypothetical protein [Mesobacillus zeae]